MGVEGIADLSRLAQSFCSLGNRVAFAGIDFGPIAIGRTTRDLTTQNSSGELAASLVAYAFAVLPVGIQALSQMKQGSIQC